MKKEKKRPSLRALTPKQSDLIQAIQDSEMVVIEGPAGTGKTFVVASLAAQYLQAGVVDRIVFTRPVVPCGKSIGYLPGELEEKLAPWVAPFMSVLSKYFTESEIEMFVKNKRIQVLPFEVMRGYSFDKSFIVLDEAQNSTPKEMQMLLTRTGQNSKTIILGDSTQSDLHQKESGLEMVKRMSRTYRLGIPNIRFSSDDIVRSGLCKKWVQAFEKESSGSDPELEELPAFITEIKPS